LPESAEEYLDEMADDIVVTGELRGAVIGDIQPELQLTPADIRAYGVGNLGELLAELAPQTRSGRGRDGGGPLVLLNGRRISGFREIRGLPPEAVERIDILPEEVALKYGYPADQRVVNIVLRPRFRSITGEAEAKAPTAGGNSEIEGELGVVRLNDRGRVNVEMEYKRTSGLLESERSIVPAGTAALFDTRGNVTGIGGGEIDPALSALAGMGVTIAPVPGTTMPTLADFAEGANQRNTTDLAPFRTLVSPSEEMSINAVLSRTLSEKISGSINVGLDATHREALLGLPGATLTLPAAHPFSPFAGDVLLHRYPAGVLPLSRDTAGRSAHVGFTLNGDALPWRWSVTGNYDRAYTRSITHSGVDAAPVQALLDAGDPSFNPFGELPVLLFGLRGPDIARSTSSVGTIQGTLNGPLAALPAGDISASLRMGARTSDFDSSSLRAGVSRAGSVSRDSGNAQLSLDLPIASRRRAVLDAIGDLSLNGNIEVQQLSDFGTLVTTGYGASWSPLGELRLLASVTDERGAPSAQQLGDPTEVTPNVRVFDYVRGETADVAAITGGNPGLGADSRNVFKLGLSAQPFENIELNFNADYVRSVTRNQIASFPSPSAEIEATFPERFVRDSTGRLVTVDTRPVNLARAEREELRWGVNLSVPLRSAAQAQIEQRQAEWQARREEAERTGMPLPERPRREGAGGRERGERGGGGRRWGGGGGGRGGLGRLMGPNGALAGRIQFSLYHTLHLSDRVVIADGLPALDLLDGGAIGSRGGQPRHEVELESGYSKDGLGLRLGGRWQSGTDVRSGPLGDETLNFSSLATFNLRAFADLGQVIGREARWARGIRLTLSVDNLFDSRLRVTDASGSVPLSYQPDLLDPTGRSVSIGIRKLFF
jgi:hypothetical protein